MSAHVAKDEIALLMPNRLAHYFTDEPEYLVVPEPNGVGFVSKLVSLLRMIVELPRRRVVLDELSALSDHELADIGLGRAELSRVFDPAFAAERNAERASLATNYRPGF